MYGSTHVKVQRTSVKRIGSALSHLVRHDDSDLEDKEEESEDDDVAACMWICVSQYVCMYMHIYIYKYTHNIPDDSDLEDEEEESEDDDIQKYTRIHRCMYVYIQTDVCKFIQRKCVCLYLIQHTSSIFMYIYKSYTCTPTQTRRSSSRR